MPIYEYECEQCGQRTEAIQRLDDAPLELCPHCGGSLRKLMSAPAFQFKGTGWYVTDYADKGKKDAKRTKSTSAKSDKASKGDSPSASSGSSSASDSA